MRLAGSVGIVTGAEQVAALTETAERAYGGLDLLFNNAGVATGLPSFPDTPPERWRRTLAINLDAVILVAQLAIPALRRRGGGAILNTASMVAINGLELDPIYAASKAGVLLFSRSLAGVPRFLAGLIADRRWQAAGVRYTGQEIPPQNSFPGPFPAGGPYHASTPRRRSRPLYGACPLARLRLRP